MEQYLVGAYLKIIKECDVVDYNVRTLRGGLEGLNELDVLGLDFKKQIAYLCEVTTHIRGTLYKDNPTTIERIKKKYERQKNYAEKYLPNFRHHRFMFWSPVVREGYVTTELRSIDGLELVINSEYTKCVDKLKEKTRILTHETNNPFFRVLQILEHLRK